jgi:hypothetical protein
MSPVERVYAMVRLSRSLEGDGRDQPRESSGGRIRLVGAGHDEQRLRLTVGLVALDSAGRRIAAEGGFGLGGPKRGLGAIWHRYRGPALSDDPTEQVEILDRTYRVGLQDIEDAINQMLGRDPELHRPPRLAWDALIAALAAHGIQVSEQELIDTPLTIELDPDVLAELSEW